MERLLLNAEIEDVNDDGTYQVRVHVVGKNMSVLVSIRAKSDDEAARNALSRVEQKFYNGDYTNAINAGTVA
jgi:hypothetical protein